MNIETSIRLMVCGERAFFPRPEFRRDMVTYDVITPAAARGILDAVHWRPALRWVVDRIHVLRPIVTEVLSVSDESYQGDRKSVVLTNVTYVLDAHFEMTARAGPDDDPVRHSGMFRRQLRRSPEVFFGKPEYKAAIRLLDPAEQIESTFGSDLDLGWMLHDADYADRGRLRFFRAHIVRGVIDIPAPDSPDIFG